MLSEYPPRTRCVLSARQDTRICPICHRVVVGGLLQFVGEWNGPTVGAFTFKLSSHNA